MEAVKRRIKQSSHSAFLTLAASAGIALLERMLEAEDVPLDGVPAILGKLKDLGIALNDPLVGLVLSESQFIDFAFWSDEPEFLQSANKLIRKDETYDKIIIDGVWNRTATWLDGFREEGVYPSIGEQRIPIAEIHSPHVDQCVGTFATTKTGSLVVKIKAFGLGYGRGRRITIKQSYQVPKECKVLTTGINFEVHVWKHKTKGNLRAHIRILEVDGTVIDEPLNPAAPHYCTTNYKGMVKQMPSLANRRGQKMPRDYSDLPMHASAGNVLNTVTLSLEKGSTYSAHLDFSLASIPGLSILVAKKLIGIPKLNITVESQVSKTVEVGWTLVGGHDYFRFRGIYDDMRFFWAWT